MTAVTDIPLPQPTELSRPFWAAANEGRLTLQRCDACGHYRWTPQILCTNCLAEPFTWVEVSGRGKLYSYTIVHRAPLAGFEVPYVLAVVELKLGVEPAEALQSELVRWCRDRLAHFKCPRRVDFVERLPRADTGKLAKHRLRDEYRARALD